MKRLGLVFLALGLAVLTAPEVSAQRPPGRGFGGFGDFRFGGPSLLTQKSVQEELKLSEDQTKKATELAAKQRESFRELRDLSPEDRRKKFDEAAKANDAAIAEILKEEQLKRFKQISLQLRGGSALGDPETQQTFNLTSEQKDQIKSIQESARSEMRGLFEGGNREEAREKVEALRKATNEKLLAVLNAEQQTKWKELTGEPFKGEIAPPEFRGGGPPGDRPRGGPRRGNRAKRSDDASSSPTGDELAGQVSQVENPDSARQPILTPLDLTWALLAEVRGGDAGLADKAKAADGKKGDRAHHGRHGHAKSDCARHHRHGRHGSGGHGHRFAHRDGHHGHGPEFAQSEGHHGREHGIGDGPRHHGPPPGHGPEFGRGHDGPGAPEFAEHHGHRPHGSDRHEHRFASWQGPHDGSRHFSFSDHHPRRGPDRDADSHESHHAATWSISKAVCGPDRDADSHESHHGDRHEARSRPAGPDAGARLLEMERLLDVFRKELDKLHQEIND